MKESHFHTQRRVRFEAILALELAYQAEKGVHEMQLRDEDVKRQQQHGRREHLRGQEDRHADSATPEMASTKRFSRKTVEPYLT